MMGRLDRSGQTSETLVRSIVFMRRTHEEAEVAHLEKHAALWSLHIKPLTRLIVVATLGGVSDGGASAVEERYRAALEDAPRGGGNGESKGPQQAFSSTSSTSADTEEEFRMEVLVRPRAMLADGFEVTADRTRILIAKTFLNLRAVQSPSEDLDLVLQPDSPMRVTFDLTGDIDLEETPSVCATPAKSLEDLWPQVPPMMTRESVQEGLRYLLAKDTRFRHIIGLIGPPTDILALLGKDPPDPFTTLAQTIVHQQLSVQVCTAMFERLLELCGSRETKVLEPERVLQETEEKIREVAKLSFRKISYIRTIAKRFIAGDFVDMQHISDAELRRHLLELPGIGEWTLEMFMLFQMQRHGAIPYPDVAVQNAMRLVYDLRPPKHATEKCEVTWTPTRAQMVEQAKHWGPYGSIATMYLLRVADNERAAIFLPES